MIESLGEIVERGWSQLLGRASGPLHFRLLIQPIVSTGLAVRAGLRDAREGRPAFLWTLLTSADERAYLARSGWKDVGKLLIVATLLDTVYQIVFLNGFFPVQTVLVVFVVALLPYLAFRGLVTRAARLLARRSDGSGTPSR